MAPLLIMLLASSICLIMTILLSSSSSTLTSAHGTVRRPDPVSLANELAWSKRRVEIDRSSSSSKPPLRLVQLDFPIIRNENENNLCDIAVGDVYEMSHHAHPSKDLYQLMEVEEASTTASSSSSSSSGKIKNKIQFKFPPVSREAHGMIGVHAQDHHHEFRFAFKTNKKHLVSTKSNEHHHHSNDGIFNIFDSKNENAAVVMRNSPVFVSNASSTFAKRTENNKNNNNDGDSEEITVGGTFLDPRLHMGEVRNEHGENKHDPNHDAHGHHSHKHDLFYVQHEESHNLRIPSDVSEVTVYCKKPVKRTTTSSNNIINKNNNGNIDLERRGKNKNDDDEESLSYETVTRTFNINDLARHAPAYIHGKLRRPSPLRRTAVEQAEEAATEPQVYPLKVRGPPRTQFNLIILAGGFSASQQKQFNDTVDRVLKFMDPTDTDVQSDPDLQSMHKTVPLTRYYPFSNVYAVWQASAQAGASRPKLGISINNNLACYHPETIERAVTCNRKLAMALASVTPANPNERPDQSAVITVVNTPLYGGSAQYKEGQFHVGYFYQGMDGENMDVYDQLKFASLFLHEANHALNNLMDEYDIGLTSSNNVYFANCQAPSAGRAPSVSNNLQWKVWAEKFQSPTEAAKYRGSLTTAYGVEPTAIPICGYSNYYKPNGNCMMQQLRDYYLCPVCRDAGTRTMLSLTSLSFAWPRFPVEDATLIVPEDAPSGDSTAITVSTGAVLHLPSFLADAGDFLVEWSDHTGAQITDTSLTNLLGCRACLHLTSTYLGGVPKDTELTITAKITDDSNFVLEDYKLAAKYKHLFYQNTSFRFKVVSSGTALSAETQQQPPLKTRSNFGYYAAVDANSYYTECFPRYEGHEPICNLTFEQAPYKAPGALGAALEAAEFYVYIILGGMALVFILMWVCMSAKFSKMEQGRIRPIFESHFTGVVDCIIKIMNLSSIGFIILSIAVLGASGFFYSRVSELGQIVIFPGIFMACGLFIMAFTGFWSLKMRSVRLIVVNGVVLYMGFTVLFLISAVIINLGMELPDKRSFWNKNLKIFWEDQVQVAPDRACGLQSMLTCSGFFISCTGVGANPSFCPANCDGPNSDYATPCQKRLTDWIADNYTNIVAVCLACLVLMGFALLFNLVFFYNIVRMKADIRRKLESQFESSHLGQFGRKSDPNSKDRALKFLQTLGETDTDKLVTEFRRIDKDGNGELDPKELRDFFKKAFCFRVNMEQIKYLFSVADRDGSGTISVPEFLALFESGERFAKSYNPDNLERSQRVDKVLTQSRTNFHSMMGAGGAGGPRKAANDTSGGVPSSPKAGGVLHVPTQQKQQQQAFSPRNAPPVSKTPSAAFPSIGMKGGANNKVAPKKAANTSRMDLLGGTNNNNANDDDYLLGSGSPHQVPERDNENKKQQPEMVKPDLVDSLLDGDGEELELL